jgi:hypothetical protein
MLCPVSDIGGLPYLPGHLSEAAPSSSVPSLDLFPCWTLVILYAVGPRALRPQVRPTADGEHCGHAQIL